MKHGWTLNSDEWNTAFKLMSEQQWRHVNLRLHHSATIPSTSGIYAFCQKASLISGAPSNSFWSTMYTPMYIGRARNLQRRFQDHLSGRTDASRIISKFNNLEYWWTEIVEAEFIQAESVMIRAFGPSANLVQGTALIGRFAIDGPANSSSD